MQIGRQERNCSVLLTHLLVLMGMFMEREMTLQRDGPCHPL